MVETLCDIVYNSLWYTLLLYKNKIPNYHIYNIGNEISEIIEWSCQLKPLIFICLV